MPARIAFLGDTLLGSRSQPTLDEHALRGLAPLLDGADLVVANHEGPVSAGAPPVPKTYGARTPSWLRADPASLDALVALDRVGIAYCGAGTDASAAQRAAAVTVAGETLLFVAGMATSADAVADAYLGLSGLRVALPHRVVGFQPRPAEPDAWAQVPDLPEPDAGWVPVDGGMRWDAP